MMLFHLTALFFTVGYAVLLTFLPQDFPHKLAWNFYLSAVLLLVVGLLIVFCITFLQNSPQSKKYFSFTSRKIFLSFSKEQIKKLLNLLAICTFLTLIAFCFHADFLNFEKKKQHLIELPQKDSPKKWKGVIKSDHVFNGKFFVLRLEPNESLKNKNHSLIEIRTKGKPRWLIPGVETEVYFRNISWLEDIEKNASKGYIDYLVANKIAGIGYTSSENFTFIKDHSTPFVLLKRNILSFIEKKSNRHLSPDVSALVMALMSGEKNHLAYDLRQNFINTGTYHILAISGLHVGLWMAIFLAILQLLKIPLRLSIIFIVLCILPFLLFLSDFPISAIRAYGLAFLGTLLFLGDRSFHLVKLITVFFFIFLFSNEHGFYALYFLSFQLSYSAVFAIFLVLPHLQKGALKNLHLLSKTFVITLVCQIATLPFLLYAFGHLHFLSALYNFIVVPLISIFLLYTLLFLLSPFNWLSGYLSNGVEMAGQFLFLLLNPSKIDHPNLMLDLPHGAFSEFFYIILGTIIFGSLFFISFSKKKYAIDQKKQKEL